MKSVCQEALPPVLSANSNMSFSQSNFLGTGAFTLPSIFRTDDSTILIINVDRDTKTVLVNISVH